MTNREKYAEEILDIACAGGFVAVSKETGRPMECGRIFCSKCAFKEKEDGCYDEIGTWANIEYVEKPKISEKDKNFLCYLNSKWNYMIRNENGDLRVFTEEPIKDTCSWEAPNFGAYNLTYGFDIDFPMVKWKNEEPWLIEDLKKLEEVEKYE